MVAMPEVQEAIRSVKLEADYYTFLVQFVQNVIDEELMFKAAMRSEKGRSVHGSTTKELGETTNGQVAMAATIKKMAEVCLAVLLNESLPDFLSALNKKEE